MAKIEGRGSASGASFSGVGMKRDISSAGAGLGSGSSLSFGGLDPSSNTLQSFPPNPKMAKMVKEAQDKRDKIERSVIAKFTPDLESARTLIEKVLEHASAAWQLSSPVAGASFQSSASYEQAKTYYLTAVRSTANALALIKHRCEECLSSLEQMHQYPVDVQEKSPWTYKSQLKQVDIFQTEFEEVFWAGSLTFVPEQATQFSQIHELVCCMAKYHAAVLKLCTIGKCEIANARNLTFGEYCTVAQATIKVFFVVMNEVTAKVAELMQAIGHYNSSMASAAPLTGNSQPHLNSNSTPQLSSSPASWQSTSALNVPVLSSQEMPTVGDTNTNVPDCLKLLRNLSSEIVLPRSISNEILLPFGIFNDVAPSPQNPTFTSNVNLNPTNLSH
uniref:Uncharacterized protein n=1 Tax=Chloropicon laureae TaxID=464258 RepID=A0A7S2Z6M5_9CHLO|mmetsp:Transcript_6819/g.17641  ORF Transcript_6819/g.17641 Transcript_6819/m.17641 type:complete len:389 (+) Transcript_6819:457-1623(+)